MTVMEVRTRVAEIEHQAGDFEQQHAMEKNLWRDVLQEIATGDEYAVEYSWELAREALKTLSIEFNRCFA